MPCGKKLCGAWLIAIYLYLGVFTPVYAEGPAPLNYIKIPSISLDSPVVPVDYQVKRLANGQAYRDWSVSNDLVNWHHSVSGNTVLTGHSDVYARVFRDLHRVSVGDLIYIYKNEVWLSYQVSEIVEVQEVGVSVAQRLQNGQYIAHKNDNRMTLVTCSRPKATHRLIIIAYPLNY